MEGRTGTERFLCEEGGRDESPPARGDEKKCQVARRRKFADENRWELGATRWIEGSGSLDPQAIDALLKLQVGDVSQPVHTPSGVHLIRLLDRQTGDLQLEQVKDEVRAHLLVYLLHYLASKSEDQLPLIANE